jgi:hypothetical protein
VQSRLYCSISTQYQRTYGDFRNVQVRGSESRVCGIRAQYQKKKKIQFQNAQKYWVDDEVGPYRPGKTKVFKR